ncbi:hypothetical protein ACS0TY_024323 [Phlomoides rotata]
MALIYREKQKNIEILIHVARKRDGRDGLEARERDESGKWAEQRREIEQRRESEVGKVRNSSSSKNYRINVLFNALWEACETSSSTGRESFVLKGGKGVAAISGTRSVKLVEVPATSLIEAVERHLASTFCCLCNW